MSEMNVQWLTYHFNIEHMLHVALEQLHQIEITDDEIDLVQTFISRSINIDFDNLFQNDSISFIDGSILPKEHDRKLKYIFHLTVSLWILLIIWSISHIWKCSFS